MNFDVIKSILPNSAYDLDRLKNKLGYREAERKLLGSISKVIKVLIRCDEGVMITDMKKKEKRIAGLNHIIGKCKKVKRKQETKIAKLEGKINDILKEPEHQNEPDVEIKEFTSIIVGIPSHEHDLVVEELKDTRRRLDIMTTKFAVNEHLRSSVKQLTSHINDHGLANAENKIDVSTQTEGPIPVDDHIVEESLTPSSEIMKEHEHHGDCVGCVAYSNKVRRERFGDEKTAIEVMMSLTKHNFMQPNKHETILLVKKAMQSVIACIKHKFSLFLARKMIDLCDLLLFSFNQMEQLRQSEIENVRKALNDLR